MRRLLGKVFDAVLAFLARTRILGPVAVAKLKYFQMLHKWPDFDHPKDLNEKVNWLKFHGDTSMWPMLADKYAVREYVREKGFGDTLVGLLGRWDGVGEIDWDSLPGRFVMKCNNGSGDAMLCRDKSELDIPATEAYFRRLLRRKYGLATSELHYAAIRPCVIAEELLDTSTQPCGSRSLVDYKVWCFDGKPSWIMCCSDRTETTLELGVYDLGWNYHPEYSVYTHHYIRPSAPVPKPECLGKMLEMAAKLSEGFPVVRVDLYEVDGKVYFGEMTLVSAGGFIKYFTDEFLLMMGEKVVLEGEGDNKAG